MSRLRFTKRQLTLLFTPPVLLATTYATFSSMADLVGPKWGYLAGFVFYWGVWCLLVPLWMAGPQGMREMFKDTPLRFGRPTWLGLIFLVGPVIAPFITMFLPGLQNVNIAVLLVSALFAVTNGTLEEVLWRGTFTTVFPDSWLFGYLYPSIGFGYWHLAPQVIHPAEMPGGPFVFASMAVFMGLTFGWVAKQSSSIRWTVIAHILTDFLGSGGLVFL